MFDKESKKNCPKYQPFRSFFCFFCKFYSLIAFDAVNTIPFDCLGGEIFEGLLRTFINEYPSDETGSSFRIFVFHEELKV